MFGKTAIKTICESIKVLMEEHQDDLIRAYGNADKALNVSVGAKIEPHEQAEFKITTSISFVAERITDNTVDFVDDDQQELFGAENGAA